MDKSATERLEAKSPGEAMIERIGRDSNLAPFMASTQFEQVRLYFEDYFNLVRSASKGNL